MVDKILGWGRGGEGERGVRKRGGILRESSEEHDHWLYKQILKLIKVQGRAGMSGHEYTP